MNLRDGPLSAWEGWRGNGYERSLNTVAEHPDIHRRRRCFPDEDNFTGRRLIEDSQVRRTAGADIGYRSEEEVGPGEMKSPSGLLGRIWGGLICTCSVIVIGI